MLIVLTGPAGGPQGQAAQALIDDTQSEWLAFDAEPEMTTALTVGYPDLAVIAERLAFPSRSVKELRLVDLSCLGSASLCERAPRPEELSDEAKRVAQALAKGQRRDVVVIHTLSRVYETLQAKALLRLGTAWGERGVEAARQVASLAIAEVSWNLAQSASLCVATAWDVETFLKGKPVGIAPSLPRATLQQAALGLRLGLDGSITAITTPSHPFSTDSLFDPASGNREGVPDAGEWEALANRIWEWHHARHD